MAVDGEGDPHLSHAARHQLLTARPAASYKAVVMAAVRIVVPKARSHVGGSIPDVGGCWTRGAVVGHVRQHDRPHIVIDHDDSLLMALAYRRGASVWQ